MSVGRFAIFRPAASTTPALLGRMTLAVVSGTGRRFGALGLSPLGQPAHEAGPAWLGLLNDRWRNAARLRLDLGLLRRLESGPAWLVAPAALGFLEARSGLRWWTALIPLTAMRSPGLAFTLPELWPPGLARALRRPASRHPEIAGTAPVPVAVNPDIARSRRQSSVFDPGGRRRGVDRGRVGRPVSRAVVHRSRHHGAARQSRRSEQENREMRSHGGIVGVRFEADKHRQQLLTAVTPGYRSAQARLGEFAPFRLPAPGLPLVAAVDPDPVTGDPELTAMSRTPRMLQARCRRC